MPKKKPHKKDWQLETYRIIYCNHKGEWITKYVRAEGFKFAYEWLIDQFDLWIIKEISNRLENGELVGKEVEDLYNDK